MKRSTTDIISASLSRRQELSSCESSVTAAVSRLSDRFRGGGKLLICGNGGSAADSLHIVSELMKDYCLHRPAVSSALGRLPATAEGRYISARLQTALPAMTLLGESAFITAFSNDVSPDMCFAQQVWGYGRPGDVLLAISTSGNSKNVVLAAITAKAAQMDVIALTGTGGGRLGRESDILIAVSESDPNLAQEAHLPIYHTICKAVENELFSAGT